MNTNTQNNFKLTFKGTGKLSVQTTLTGKHTVCMGSLRDECCIQEMSREQR